jgi:hypothetical protein
MTVGEGSDGSWKKVLEGIDMVKSGQRGKGEKLVFVVGK